MDEGDTGLTVKGRIRDLRLNNVDVGRMHLRRLSGGILHNSTKVGFSGCDYDLELTILLEAPAGGRRRGRGRGRAAGSGAQ